MQSHLVILVCLAVGLQAAPERPEGGLKCPRSQGLFAHPTDCHLFLHCDHGHPYVKDCPANLHFNARLMVCDWPENAGCKPGQPTDAPTPSVPPDPDVECDCECCLKPSGDDCTTFYLCKDGKAYLESCATGLVFNPNIQNCDSPSNYQCDDSGGGGDDDFDCPKDGLYPNPKDCHTFYHCSNGHAYLKDCPANLDFDPRTERCEWPEKAGCRGTTPHVPDTTTKRSTTTATTPSVFVCPKDGLYPNPKDCHTFYHCSNGHAYLKDCPANLDFDPRTERCEWPEEAGCRGTTPHVPDTTTKRSTTTATTPSGFDCPKSNGLFPNPKDCHTFYHCSNGHAYLKECPANLEFNPILLVCDWPEHAGCGGTTPHVPDTTTKRPTTTASTPSGFDCPKSNGLFPNPKDCHTFYHCSNGHAYLKECPANLEFNPVLLVCDWPDKAGCSHKVSTTPAATTKPSPTTPNSGFDCPTSNGLFPNPKDCHSFYHCSNGHAYLKECPANLEFNPVLLVCDWPEHAGCGGTVPTRLPTTTPKPDDDIICPDDTCVCRLPNKYNCSSYYECHNGKAYPESCPSGLYFNPDKEVCDLPSNVECDTATSTTKPTTTTPTTTTTAPPPPCTFPCSKSDGYYANPLNCGTYFQCADGKATIRFCPSGTHFNTGTNACDAPASAGCCDL